MSQDAPAIVLVAVVGSLLAGEHDLGSGAIAGLLALSTLVAGLTLFALGRLGLGEPVRYLPTVVVQGFIAGTGWLLLRGGFEVAIGEPMSLDRLGWLVEPNGVGRWFPAVVLAVVITVLGSSDRAPAWASSAVTVVSVAGFYVVFNVFSSHSQARDSGWLVGPFESTASPVLVRPQSLVDLPWAALGGSLGDLLSLLVVTVVALLLNLSALEAIRQRRIETGYELRQTGIANIVIAALGATPVFHALGDTVLAERMGVMSRTVPISVGLTSAAFGLFGTEAIGYVPLFVAGGMLVSVGLALFVSFAGFLRGPLGWIDRIMSCAIVALIMVIGILEGVVVGLILACGLFIIRYSRVDVVRRLSDGSSSRSRVDRTAEEAQRLAERGGRTQILELQGYVFFASATRLVDTLRDLTESGGGVRTVVVDLRFVTGVEPGTSQVLAPVFLDLQARGIEVLVSGPESMRGQMVGDSAPTAFSTLDEALADVEDRLLAVPVASDEADGDEGDVVGQSSESLGVGGPDDRSTVMLAGFERRTVSPGEYLIQEGSSADEMIYLLEGTVSVVANSGSGSRHRLRRTDAPSWMGEIGFLRESRRTADVIAETAVVCAVVGRDDFERMVAESPSQADLILRDIALTAADRAASLSQALADSLE